MTPDTIPIFEDLDVLPSNQDEYEVGERRTAIGWMKFLVLWREEGDFLMIQPQDRKDYAETEKVFREANNIGARTDLMDWEEGKTIKQQTAALNKWRKAMGYTETVE